MSGHQPRRLRCSDSSCREETEDTQFAKIRAQDEGWFFARDGQSRYCPRHVPPWVAGWRIHRSFDRRCPYCLVANGSRGIRALGRSDSCLLVESAKALTSGHLVAIPVLHFWPVTANPALAGKVMAFAAQAAERSLDRPVFITDLGGVEHMSVHVLPRPWLVREAIAADLTGWEPGGKEEGSGLPGSP